MGTEALDIREELYILIFVVHIIPFGPVLCALFLKAASQAAFFV